MRFYFLALFVHGVIGINLISAVGVIMKMDIRVATLEDVQIEVLFSEFKKDGYSSRQTLDIRE